MDFPAVTLSPCGRKITAATLSTTAQYSAVYNVLCQNKYAGNCAPVRRGAHYIVVFQNLAAGKKVWRTTLACAGSFASLQAAQLRHEQAGHVQAAGK